jgi:hypothetical protein
LVTYASSQLRGKKFLIEHVVNVKTLNDSEHHGRSFFYFIEIENFRGEGKILMRPTHDTTFSEKILDFYKILQESEQFFILFFDENSTHNNTLHAFQRTMDTIHQTLLNRCRSSTNGG